MDGAGILLASMGFRHTLWKIGEPGATIPATTLEEIETMSQLRHRQEFPVIVLLSLLATTVATSTASAYPALGQNAGANCYLCHDQWATNRSELFDFSGLIDPPERSGVPDRGLLPYFTVQAGQTAAIKLRAIDGAERYAFQYKGFDGLDVTAGGVLIFRADDEFLAFTGSGYPPYYVAADGAMDGYDWGTSDPTEVSFDAWVNPAADPGYYLLTLALVGVDPGETKWYQEHLVYLEVAPRPGAMVLQVGPIRRGATARMQATGAAPNAIVYFIYSVRGYGNTTVSQLGVTLGLDQPALLGQSRANSTGTATFSQFVPPSTPPVPVWLQAAQVGNVSNVVASRIE